MLDLYKKKISENGQIYLSCKVCPGAVKTKIDKIILTNEVLCISVSAPADKNKANKELIRFLAKEFNVLKSQVFIITGKTDRIKLIKIIKI